MEFRSWKIDLVRKDCVGRSLTKRCLFLYILPFFMYTDVFRRSGLLDKSSYRLVVHQHFCIPYYCSNKIYTLLLLKVHYIGSFEGRFRVAPLIFLVSKSMVKHACWVLTLLNWFPVLQEHVPQPTKRLQHPGRVSRQQVGQPGGRGHHLGRPLGHHGEHGRVQRQRLGGRSHTHHLTNIGRQAKQRKGRTSNFDFKYIYF